MTNMNKEESVNFNDYAQYYNLLYKDKNYREEVNYVKNLIERERPGTLTILDLGCGTGRHDKIFVEEGFLVTGVDYSEQMISIAKKNEGENLKFIHGDARKVEIDNNFDVVIALFHVMSYQITNEDLIGVFSTAKSHLNPGGVFIFDCWYGPAVLTDRPTIRIKRLEDEKIELVRISEPEMNSNNNIVEVSFNVLIKDKSTGCQKEINEKHSMRYLFYPEIELIASNLGFRITVFEEWLTGNRPDFNSWNVVFCCKKL